MFGRRRIFRRYGELQKHLPEVVIRAAEISVVGQTETTFRPYVVSVWSVDYRADFKRRARLVDLFGVAE